MNGWTSLLILAAAFAGSMLFSGLETGGYVLNRIRLRARARQGDRSARRLQESLRDARRFVFTVLIGNNIVNYLLSRETTRLYDAAGAWNAETAATLTLMLPLFLFGELIPKNVFRHRAETLMYRCSGLLRFAERLFSPLSVFLARLFDLLSGGRARLDERGHTLSLEGFREYFAEGPQQGALNPHQHGMIDKLISMHRVPVRQVMQPAAAMAQIPETASIRAAVEQMRACGADQTALCRGPSRQITGFVYLADLTDPALKPDDPVRPLLHPAVRADASMPLTHAFRMLRKSGRQTAAVTDRAGRTVGLLDLRDIARYIVSGP